MTKKLLSVVLAIVMLMSCLYVSAFAVVEQGDADITEYPVILVPGYSGSDLNITNEYGYTEKCWGLDMNEILGLVLKRIVDLGKGLVLTAEGDSKKLADTVGEEMVNLLGCMACNPDGTSVNNISVAYPTADVRQMSYLIEEYGENTNEPELFAAVSERIGTDNCFFYQSDWRMSAYDCATGLVDFIQQVKEITGKDKVNLIAVSHGGQVTATYLSLYGYMQDVDNAVLTVPAAGGAALAYDIMSGNVKLDEYTLIYFIQHGLVSEDNFKWLTQAQQLGFLDDVIENLLPYIYDVIGYFPSIWDFIPTEYYEDVKALRLDPVESAALIEKSDYVHYEIMEKYNENLSKCIDDYGMNVTIIAGTGNPSVTGLGENSDAIISTNDSTGATCAHFGERFNDGYTGLKTTCSNPLHNHVSPSFEVDGSTAYLPENTWYVDELFHGMTFLDSYTLNLALTTLLTDRITDVYSDADYPQFHVSTNANNCIYAYFDNSAEGQVSSADEYLCIENISKENVLTVSSVEFCGAPLKVNAIDLPAIEPGKTLRLKLSGNLPEESLRLMQVNIDYYCDGRILTPNGSRTFNFTVMNGEPVVYDETEPFVPADFTSRFETALGEDTVDTLTGLGLVTFIKFFYDWFMAIMDAFGLSRYL